MRRAIEQVKEVLANVDIEAIEVNRGLGTRVGQHLLGEVTHVLVGQGDGQHADLGAVGAEDVGE